MNPDSPTLNFWNSRAQSYEALCRSWDLFALLAGRLAGALPEGFAGQVLDIGAGTGQSSQSLLRLRPACRPALVEPSEGMLALARGRLAGTAARFFACGLGEAVALGLRADAAVSSAVMHYVDLDPAFGALAALLRPGGLFAFNLWWHNWEETAGLAAFQAWLPHAEAACREAGLAIAPGPPLPRAAKTRAGMAAAARRHGFGMAAEARDEDVVPVAFSIDFNAMDPDWPVKGLAEDRRRPLLGRMRELAEGKRETLVTKRFVFLKI